MLAERAGVAATPAIGFVVVEVGADAVATFRLGELGGEGTGQAAHAAVERVVILVYARPVAAILVIGAKMRAIAADAPKPPLLEVGANTSTQKGTAIRVIGWADAGHLAAADTYPTYGAGNARPGAACASVGGALMPTHAAVRIVGAGIDALPAA
jgi:hypothetical protein